MNKQNLFDLTSVSFPAIDKFVSCENLKNGYDKIWIANIHDSFSQAFSDKVETSVQKEILHVRAIEGNITYSQVVSELGGEEIVETTLAHMFEFMKEAGKRDVSCAGSLGTLIHEMDKAKGHGPLLVQGVSRFIFCIRDASGALWEINCYFSSLFPQWGISANQLTDSTEWRPGRGGPC